MLSEWMGEWTRLLFILDFGLRLYFGSRVLKRRLPVGVAWAWLTLILAFPFLGTFFYLHLGEYRLGRRREGRLLKVAEFLKHKNKHAAAPTERLKNLAEPAASLGLNAQSLFQAPVLEGNDVLLLKDASQSFEKMIRDIDQAKVSCEMEFYIWSDGGKADLFGEALLRAADRGVIVRVLVDQIGSAKFLRGPMAKRLREAGIRLQAALPSGFFRSLINRPDLRIHRKILIIDRSIAYVGSLNLADPAFFNLRKKVGPWVDATARLTGSIVESLITVFLTDWSVETASDYGQNEKLSLPETLSGNGRSRIQCLASGPAAKASSIEQVIVSAIYLAQKEIVMTTPYFIPSEALQYALTSAARRGVQVTLIVPMRMDSHLAQYAGRAFMTELLEAGVHIQLYRNGMLHTKSITIDRDISFFGSLNLDARSFRINFEITLLLYDPEFTAELLALQERYRSESSRLTLDKDRHKTTWNRTQEDIARLLSPLL